MAMEVYWESERMRVMFGARDVDFASVPAWLQHLFVVWLCRGLKLYVCIVCCHLHNCHRDHNDRI